MLSYVAYQAQSRQFWNALDGLGDRSTYFLGGSMSCGKGQPMQLAPVSHGVVAARFRDIAAETLRAGCESVIVNGVPPCVYFERGEALGIDLELVHQPVAPAAGMLTLVSRRDYGDEVQAPSAILRFALPSLPLRHRLTKSGFAGFRAGDLLGIVPQGSTVPRFYSLASGRRDGFIEIVVRKHPGGLCSGQLTGLEPGESVTAFLRPNPAFHPGRGRAPLILIGAGTGIGPLAGMVRANRRRRPVHLFFGLRQPDSDFFYGEELAAWRADSRLARLVTAVSRGARPHYVQDALRTEGAEIARLIRNGARVMVCGGRDMAAGVADAIGDILMPHGLTPAALKAEGRYVEDVY